MAAHSRYSSAVSGAQDGAYSNAGVCLYMLIAALLFGLLYPLVVLHTLQRDSECALPRAAPPPRPPPLPHPPPAPPRGRPGAPPPPPPRRVPPPYGLPWRTWRDPRGGAAQILARPSKAPGQREHARQAEVRPAAVRAAPEPAGPLARG